MIDEELERLLPERSRQRVLIGGAGHGMWFQQPEACRKAVREFLRGKLPHPHSVLTCFGRVTCRAKPGCSPKRSQRSNDSHAR